MQENNFNGYLIMIEFLPQRARTKTDKQSFSDSTFEGAINKAQEELIYAKKIVSGSVRQCHIEKQDNGIVWTKYPMYCPTYRKLSNEEISIIQKQ